MSGVGGLKRFFTMFCAAFPNLSHTVDDEIAEEDMVIQGVNWPLVSLSLFSRSMMASYCKRTGRQQTHPSVHLPKSAVDSIISAVTGKCRNGQTSVT
jgi:hypothetical protein